MPPPSTSPIHNARTCYAWPVPTPPPRPSSAAHASSSAPPTRTGPPTSASPPSSAARTTPSPCGADASPKGASTACTTPHDPAARRSFPPEARLHVIELATREDPADAGCPTGSWSLDDVALTLLREADEEDRILARIAAARLAATRHFAGVGEVGEGSGGTGEEWQAALLALLAECRPEPMSRSTIQRILTGADLKPHRSVYWLKSHAPDFGAKAAGICRLYLDSSRLWEEDGELVISTDEKTGILIRRRKHPTVPIRPGSPRLREHEYVRLGSTHLSASFCVPTGQVVHDLTRTHTGDDFCAHLRHAVKGMPEARRYHWVLDNNLTHSTPAVCALVAEMSGIALPAVGLETAKARRAWLGDPTRKHSFRFTPVHGSWLNQVEMFFSVLSRKLLRRDDFPSAEAFVARLESWMGWYNREWAHPYRWTYAGTPLVRATPFDRTLKQKKRGRAFFGTRPKPFERLFFPPRPYHKAIPA